DVRLRQVGNDLKTVARRHRGIDAVQINTLPARNERENSFLVFQKHERSLLCSRRLRLELRIANNALHGSRVYIGILEQSLPEFLHSNAINRFVDSLLADLSCSDSLNDELRFLGAPELIDTCIHGFCEAIDLGQ